MSPPPVRGREGGDDGTVQVACRAGGRVALGAADASGCSDGAQDVARVSAPNGSRMPCRSMRRQSVTREMPSAAAARCRFQRWSFSTRRMRARSSGQKPPARRRRGAQHAWRDRAPSAPARMSSDSSVFSSSRTFPGQGWSRSGRSCAAAGTAKRVPCRRLKRGDEVGHEQRQVGAPLAQRRQLDGEHAQPVVEVAPEGARLDHAPQLAIRRGDEPRRRHAAPLLAPSGRTSPSCTTRRSFACSDSGRSSISSRKSVPPSARRSAPGRASQRAGERAARVAEELALGERLRDRGAVDGDERAARPGAQLVDGPRDDLLAGAGLTLDAAPEHPVRGRGPDQRPDTRCIGGLAPTRPSISGSPAGAGRRARAQRRESAGQVRRVEGDVVGRSRPQGRTGVGGAIVWCRPRPPALVPARSGTALAGRGAEDDQVECDVVRQAARGRSRYALRTVTCARPRTGRAAL